jgi:hypothetical protein
MWRLRLAALAAGIGFLGVALGIRVLASTGGVLDSSGALAQYSGTALYASETGSSVPARRTGRTRSGPHRVAILAIDGQRVQVRNLEAWKP